VQSVLEVSQVGIDPDVLIGDVVSIEIADYRQVRGIGDPEVASMPSQTLDGVKPAREGLDPVCLTIPIVVEDQHYGVAGGLRLGVSILRPHSHAQTAAPIEGHGARLPHQRLLREKGNVKPRRHDRERLAIHVTVKLPTGPLPGQGTRANANADGEDQTWIQSVKNGAHG
jgi:hypothetical protein